MLPRVTGIVAVVAISCLAAQGWARSVSFAHVRFASDYAAGSSTGGIQEAISAASYGETVYVDPPVSAKTEIDMKPGVSVRCSPHTRITFTGATNGFVWPPAASRANLYGCEVVAANPSAGKAIDIEGTPNAAGNVSVEDVTIAASSPPKNNWAYGFFLSNAMFGRFDRVEIQAAKVPIYADGFSNDIQFTGLNATLGVVEPVFVDIRGGSPVTFIGGDIEGNAPSELMRITQPGPATTNVHLIGARFENTTGAGIVADGGSFYAYALGMSVRSPLGFVIGEHHRTYNCQIFGGHGASWTLGPKAKRIEILGYMYGGSPPVDKSMGRNAIYNNPPSNSSSMNVGWTTGNGSPKGACKVGSLYSRTDGVPGATLYICEGPSGTWAAK